MIFFALIQYNSSKSYPTSGEHEKRTVVVAHSVAAERKSKERFRCSETGCVTASLIIFFNYLLILCLSQNQRCCRERVLRSSKVTPVAPDPDTKVNKKISHPAFTRHCITPIYTTDWVAFKCFPNLTGMDRVGFFCIPSTAVLAKPYFFKQFYPPKHFFFWYSSLHLEICTESCQQSNCFIDLCYIYRSASC